MDVPAQDLGRAVKRLQSRHHRRLDAALQGLGTTLAQWDALRAIDGHPGVSAHALAELTFQSDQSFGALAARLVEKGLVERRPGPGRTILHALSAEGRHVLSQGGAVVDGVLEASFRTLSDCERQSLFRLLEKALSEKP